MFLSDFLFGKFWFSFIFYFVFVFYIYCLLGSHHFFPFTFDKIFYLLKKRCLRMPKAGDFVTLDFFFAKNVSFVLLMIDFILQQGRFLSSLNTQSPALNVVSRRFLWNFGFFFDPFYSFLLLTISH